jgi:hypothetical protein
MRPSARQNTLLGAAGVVAVIFVADYLTRGGEPQPAVAAGTGAAVESRAGDGPGSAGERAALERVDVSAVLAALSAPRVQPIGNVETMRDLFAPGPELAALWAVAEAPAAPAHVAAKPEPAEPPFSSRHRLDGVITGSPPLAIIDGVPVGIGSRVEGYEVLEIERDRVVLGRGGETVVLRLQQKRP